MWKAALYLYAFHGSAGKSAPMPFYCRLRDKFLKTTFFLHLGYFLFTSCIRSTVDPDRIQIQWVPGSISGFAIRIRIQEGKNDPQT
jgi:hypothetical protein